MARIKIRKAISQENHGKPSAKQANDTDFSSLTSGWCHRQRLGRAKGARDVKNALKAFADYFLSSRLDRRLRL